MHPALALIERRLSDLGKEVERFEQALQMVSEHRLFEGKLSWLALSGLSAGTSAVHSGMERILAGIMETIDGWAPSGGRSHQDILDAASIRTENRPPIVSEELYTKLVETKSFRHFDRQNYRFVLDAEKTLAAARLATETARSFIIDIRKFLKEFDEVNVHENRGSDPKI